MDFFFFLENYLKLIVIIRYFPYSGLFFQKKIKIIIENIEDIPEKAKLNEEEDTQKCLSVDTNMNNNYEWIFRKIHTH